jgi:hypothetical protein
MGQYAGQSQFPNNIYEYDVTDPVIGGPNGIANKPMHDLADRTQWLKDQIGLVDRFNGDIVLTVSAPIVATLAGNLITVYATGINNFQLDDVHSFAPGSIIPFSSFANPGCVNNIKTQPGQTIFDTDGGKSQLSMHHKEQLILVAFTDHWKVIYGPGNFNCVGEEVKARKALPNTLALKGQLLNRDQYPRLWNWVNSNLTMFQEIVTESLFFGYGLTYQGCFTNGDNVSTFRVPDERGMSERMLDLGRGIDYLRQHNFPGGYEADNIKSHVHNFKDRYFAESGDQFSNVPKYIQMPDNGKNLGSGRSDTGNNYAPYVDDVTDPAGTTETTVKNVGKLSLIKY